MKESKGKPYYGYRINKYITAALVGAGIIGIVLAIAFTVLGVFNLGFGIMLGFGVYTAHLRGVLASFYGLGKQSSEGRSP